MSGGKSKPRKMKCGQVAWGIEYKNQRPRSGTIMGEVGTCHICGMADVLCLKVFGHDASALFPELCKPCLDELFAQTAAYYEKKYGNGRAKMKKIPDH